MPKLNTFLAATLFASTFAATAYAGEPGYTGSRTHPGHASSQYGAQTGHVLYGSAQAPTYRTYGSVQTSASSHAQASASASAYSSSSSAYSSASASAHSSYSSAGSSYGAGYGYTGATHGGPNYVMNTAGPVDIYSDEIICTLHGEEVPCDAIPGLAEALRAQGMSSIADALPPYRGGPAVDYMYDGSYASGYGQTSYAHTGASYQGSSYASASSSSYAAGYGQTYVPSHQSGSYHHGQQEVWVTPCGQVITTVSGHIPPCNAPVYYEPAPAPAPVSVRLTDGTVFAMFGGVGSGVHGEYYGGGGTYIEGGATYSGVLNHAASNYTFRRRTREHNPPSNPPHNPPCGGGCGHDGGGGGYHGGGGHNGGGYHGGGGHNGGGYHGGGGHNGGGYHGGGRGGRGGGHNGGNHGGGGGSCGGGC